MASGSELSLLICPLTGMNLFEILENDLSDVMVFPLRVSRAEYTLEAPSEVVLMDVLHGCYSNSAVNGAIAHALQLRRAEMVHGGFSKPTEDVGLFKGDDGKYMNAVLPMYLHKEHWKRVMVEIEPMLGYFFTLDPLGFKGDQYLAIFSVLGQMLSSRARGQFTSDYHSWVLQDFTRVCGQLRTKALRYLAAGLYASGKMQIDPVDAFITHPACRTKEVIPNLHTIMGWYHVRDVEGNISTENKHRYMYALIEETYRRVFAKAFATTPFAAEEWITRLIYGKHALLTSAAADDEEEVTSGRPKINDNTEKQFATYAKYKLDLLTRKQKEIAAKHFANSMGPKFETDPGADLSHAKSLSIATDEDTTQVVLELRNMFAKEFGAFMALYNPTLALAGTEHFDPVNFVDVATCRYMMLQAMLYIRNSDMNAVAGRDGLINIYDAQKTNTLTSIASAAHADYQRRLNEKSDAAENARECLFIAKCIATSRTAESFVGRMMVACPTRGGNVFLRLVQLLTLGSLDGVDIPLLAVKVRAIMTGKTTFEVERQSMMY
jgi:hypothetical protein